MANIIVLALTIPYPSSPEAARIISDFRVNLAKVAGGWTSYDTEGCWIDDTGALVQESSERYEVGFPDEFIFMPDKILQLFRQLGVDLGQKELYITSTQQTRED